MRFKKLILILVLALGLMIILCSVAFACTVIVVGKKVSTDGSVINSHTCDFFYDASLTIIPAADHEPEEMAPVYFNKLHAHSAEVKKMGEIPQVSHTYKYFWIAYPIANEHQVIIGETTIGGNPLLTASPDAIMWIEQLESLALERAKTAREAIQIMGELADKYGYADGGENLTVTDPNEAWSFEIFPVGPLWSPKSGKPGAVWCAQRIPDDHIYAAHNFSRIDQIDPNDTENFMVRDNYIDTAVELGLYDPASGEPFSWRKVYGVVQGYQFGKGWSPRILGWGRLWTSYSVLAPSVKDWNLDNVPNYPFSVKPDKKVSVQDVLALQGNVLAGTKYDNAEAAGWYVKTKKGCIKSPLATPHITTYIGDLVKIPYIRPIASFNNSYSFVSQARDWLPDEIGGIFWFHLDNPDNSLAVPVWSGVNEIAPSWAVADCTKLNRDSAWWAFGLVDDQVNHLYGELKPVLDDMRVPLQKELFAKQDEIEQEALKLYKTSPEDAQEFLTDYTVSTMKRVEKAYWNILDVLLYKLNNNWFVFPH